MGASGTNDSSRRPSLSVRLLGPVSVTIDGMDRPLSARRQRAVLAVLALRAGEAVSADALLDAVWGDDLPQTGARAVAFQISKLRSVLEPDRSDEGSVVVTSPAGYQLDVEPDQVDVHRFDQLVTEARDALAADPSRCLPLIEEALALWSARPFADLAHEPFVDVEVRRLEQRHLLARRTLAEARIASGRHVDVIADLEAMIGEHPLEESLVHLLMTALHRSGRTADALRAFGELRMRLSTELGIEPSNELQRLEGKLLAGDSDTVGTGDDGGATSRLTLPSGVVTFVLTDIEASTRLLRRLPDRAPDLFDRHDAILRSAWRAHGGHEISTEGDSFFVAFADTANAFAACSMAQRSLHDEPWPENGTIKVRIGIHAGPAVQRGDNYVALAVHQAARVAAAAQGGQTLVTEAAARRAAPPGGTRLTPLGRYRVRDFDEPEPLYRLDHEGVRVSDQPIRATPAERHNLVPQPTSFRGRNADVASVIPLLGHGRAITLSGPGGVGKTRLATEVGLSVVGDWADGVWFVDLADLMDSAVVPETVATAIGAPSGDASSRWDDVIAHLRERSALVILDNIEQHIDACALLVPELLAECRAVGVMTTGREPLNIAGESIYRVDPLPIPAIDGEDVEIIARSPAVRLFCDRARATDPGFELDATTAVLVARICARLDGLPLALEIAGARVGVLSVRDILDGLDDRFRLLKSRSRTLPARHRTMQGVLDWGYRLLDEREQIALRRLAVFAGTFSVDGATEALASGDLPADDVAELVWGLVDKSLVVADLTDSETRYRLHESVRDYGAQLLDQSDETAVVAERLVVWFLARLGPRRTNDRQWISQVGIELANLRALVGLLADADPESAQQVACTVARYHESVQSFSSGIDELSAAVASLTRPTPSRVVMLTSLADLHLRRAEVDAARELLDAARELEAEVGSAEWADAAVERTRGELAIRAGELVEAAAIARHALAGDLSPTGQARMWSLLGVARYSDGDIAAAAEAFGRELDAYNLIGDDSHIATAHGNLAEVTMRLGDRVGAAHHQRECLELARALELPVTLAYSCILASRFASEQGRFELAVVLQSAGETVLTAAGHALYEADRAASDQFMADARSALGTDVYERAVAHGGSLDLFDATRSADEVLSAVAAGRALPDVDLNDVDLNDEANPRSTS